MTDTNLQIIDFYWDYDTKSKKYSQVMKLLNRENLETKKINLRNYKFDYILSENRYCPGFSDKEGYHECKYKNVLEKKSYDLCYTCEKNLGFKAAFLFGQEPNQNMKTYLSQEHFIYLAYFQPEIIKVGTAAGSRKNVRPIEQDALIYAYIAESDGFNVQRFEKAISRGIGLTEFVKSSVKLKNIYTKPNPQRAKLLINKYFSMIQDRFKDNDEFGSWLFEEIETIDVSSNQEIYYPEREVEKIQENDLNLVGLCKGMRGRYLILENNTHLMIKDVREIIGREIIDYSDNYTYHSTIEEEDNLRLI